MKDLVVFGMMVVIVVVVVEDEEFLSYSFLSEMMDDILDKDDLEELVCFGLGVDKSFVNLYIGL